MSQLLIKDVDDDVRRRLAELAAQSGRTIEDEVNRILMDAVRPGSPAVNLADLADELFGKNGVELEPHPPVGPPREPLFEDR